MKLFHHIFFMGITFNLLQACAVCYGSPDEPAVKAAQMGIVFLLGVVLFVLSCFALFIYNLNKQSKKV